MRPNCRSSGAATDVAMVSGLAPRQEAKTKMVGKSTCGRGDGQQANAPGRPEPFPGQQRGRDRPFYEEGGEIHAGSG